MGFDRETEGSSGLRRLVIGGIILAVVGVLGYMWFQHIAKTVEATEAEIDRSGKRTLRNLRKNIRGQLRRPVDPDEVIDQARR